MSYTPPDLSVPVVLQGGYDPPDLSVPVVLCQEAGPDYVDGTLSVSISAPTPSAAFAASEQPARGGESLWTKTLYRPADPALSATTQQALPADLAATTDPIITEPVFRGRERGYFADLAVTTNPLIVDPTLAGIAERIHAIHVDILALPLIIEPSITTQFSQDLELPDNQGPALQARQAQANPTHNRLFSRWADMAAIQTPTAMRHADMLPIRVGSELVAAQMQALQRPGTQSHAHGLRITAHADSPHAETIRTRRPLTQSHAHGLRITASTTAGHADTRKTHSRLSNRSAEAVLCVLGLAVDNHEALQTTSPLNTRWAHMIWPAPGRWWPFYEPPGLTLVIPCTGDYVPRPLYCPVVLDWKPIPQPYCEGFDEPPSDQIIIPIRRIYFMLHSATLVRLPDRTEIPCQALQLAIDLDSYTWRMSGTVLGNTAWDALQPAPDPVEVEATINGYIWRAVIEDISRSERFGSRLAISISGRGLAAYLDVPYAPVSDRSQPAARNLRQLADEALTLTGWSINAWEAADWLVPGGVWNHHGTPLQAVIRLIQAAGGSLQADRSNTTLRVLPRYPILPWYWYDAGTTPDVILPPDVVTESAPRLIRGADVNGLYVSGEAQGILALVRRAATLGDKTAPMIIDNLITHIDGARALGSKQLAELTGDRYEQNLTLPLSAAGGDTPLITPGSLISYDNDVWRGLVEGVTVSAGWSQEGGLVVRQQLHIERRNP